MCVIDKYFAGRVYSRCGTDALWVFWIKDLSGMPVDPDPSVVPSFYISIPQDVTVTSGQGGELRKTLFLFIEL